MAQKFGIIYKITNKINGKVYIGQTISLLKYRWQKHLNDCGGCHKLRRALDKYGKDNFVIEIISEAINQQELNEQERYYISLFNAIKAGYNIREGGKDGKWNPESIEKMRKSQQIKNAYKKISVLQIDLNFNVIKKWDSIKEAEKTTKLKITDCLKGRRNIRGGFIWVYADADLEKEKLRLTKVRLKNKKVGQYNLDNNLIKVFKSPAEAARILNISPSGISQTCTGKLNTFKGYIWRYI